MVSRCAMAVCSVDVFDITGILALNMLLSRWDVCRGGVRGDAVVARCAGAIVAAAYSAESERLCNVEP